MLIIYALSMAVFVLQGRAEYLRQRQCGLQSRKCLLFGLFPERKSLLSSVLYDWDRDVNNKGSALLLTLHSVKEMVRSRRRIKERWRGAERKLFRQGGLVPKVSFAF